MNYKDTPVFINNRNRLQTLSSLITWLERMKFQNIFVLDNASTFPPLLDYYNKTSHKIIYLHENVGYLAFWESELFDQFRNTHFIYSDSDVLPSETCPEDFMEVFHRGLEKYPQFHKIGFSLQIDDLPVHCRIKDNIVTHENNFWLKRLDSMYFDAAIDTTFALYRPHARGGWWAPAIRTAPPYIARHLPWYQNPDDLTEEELFYKNNASATTTYWTSRL